MIIFLKSAVTVEWVHDAAKRFSLIKNPTLGNKIGHSSFTNRRSVGSTPVFQTTGYKPNRKEEEEEDKLYYFMCAKLF